MHWVILTFVVAVLNLILGYVLAVQMGCGPRTLREAWEALLGRSRRRVARDASVDALIQSLVEEPEAAKPAPPSPEVTLRDMVQAFQPDLLKNEANLIQVDTDLRTTEPPTAETVAAHAQALQANCETYLADLEKASAHLQSQFDDLGALKPLGQQIDMALVEQSTQFDATVRNLGQRDLTAEPIEGAKQLKEETVSLLSMMHQLRDYLATAFMAIVRQDRRICKTDESQKLDPLTNAPNRIGMEMALQEWWEQNRFRDQANCAVLFDFDSFVAINKEFGVAAGKHVLRTVVEQMRQCMGPNDSIFRYSGQQIAIFVCGVDAAGGMQTARLISTMVQASPVTYGGHSIPVRITGTVVPILARSTPRDILARLEEELGTAKRITPGRVYLSDKAKAPPPVFNKGETARAF